MMFSQVVKREMIVTPSSEELQKKSDEKSSSKEDMGDDSFANVCVKVEEDEFQVYFKGIDHEKREKND